MTEFMIKEQVPALAKDMDAKPDAEEWRYPISRQVHGRGINLRHMGLLRRFKRSNPAKRCCWKPS